VHFYKSWALGKKRANNHYWQLDVDQWWRRWLEEEFCFVFEHLAGRFAMFLRLKPEDLLGFCYLKPAKSAFKMKVKWRRNGIAQDLPKKLLQKTPSNGCRNRLQTVYLAAKTVFNTI
jgi:hypothetical protein